MELGRLDEIVKSNVELSTQKNVEEQKLYVLQDISVTLAMIYDKLNGMKAIKSVEEEKLMSPISVESLSVCDWMYLEEKGKEPRLVQRLEYEVCNSDAMHTFGEYDNYAIVLSDENRETIKKRLGNYMRTWRCWYENPTKREMEKTPWRE